VSPTGTVEGKVHPITGHDNPEWEWRCSCTLSLTSALDGGGQRHAPTALPPGKTWYPLYRRVGGPQGRSGRVRKIFTPPGFDPPDRPARSESLYRLSYPGSFFANRGKRKFSMVHPIVFMYRHH